MYTDRQSVVCCRTECWDTRDVTIANRKPWRLQNSVLEDEETTAILGVKSYQFELEYTDREYQASTPPLSTTGGNDRLNESDWRVSVLPFNVSVERLDPLDSSYRSLGLCRDRPNNELNVPLHFQVFF